jgi:hypothetical protein
MLQEIALLVEMFCARTGLDRQFVRQLADIPIASLGRDFFEFPRYAKNPMTLEQTLAHPLLKRITVSPPEVGIGELVELGIYLSAFAADLAITKILASLRNSREYESTLFHLAIAYRLGQAGCNPALEPKTDRGKKSDILFNFEGRTYVAECYRVNVSIFKHLGEFESVLARRLNHATPPSRKYRFRIHINALLTNDGMRRMVQKADELLSLFHSRANTSAEVQLRYGEHMLGIEDITDAEPDPDFDNPNMPARPLRNGEADRIVCSTAHSAAANAANIFELRETPAYQARGSRTLILRGYEHDWPKSPYDVLEGKVAHKLKQTKISNSNYGRLLFVEFPWGLRADNRETLGRQDKLRTDFTRRFPDVAGIVLLERRPLKRHFGYQGTLLAGRDVEAAPEKLFAKLAEVEAKELFSGHPPTSFG